MEVAAGLEPAKTGFADQRLGLFVIATSKRLNQPIPDLYPNCTQMRPIQPRLPHHRPCKSLKTIPTPESTYHLAIAPSGLACNEQAAK